jgi:hypothetical protein
MGKDKVIINSWCGVMSVRVLCREPRYTGKVYISTL